MTYIPPHPPSATPVAAPLSVTTGVAALSIDPLPPDSGGGSFRMMTQALPALPYLGIAASALLQSHDALQQADRTVTTGDDTLSVIMGMCLVVGLVANFGKLGIVGLARDLYKEELKVAEFEATCSVFERQPDSKKASISVYQEQLRMYLDTMCCDMLSMKLASNRQKVMDLLVKMLPYLTGKSLSHFMCQMATYSAGVLKGVSEGTYDLSVACEIVTFQEKTMKHFMRRGSLEAYADFCSSYGFKPVLDGLEMSASGRPEAEEIERQGLFRALIGQFIKCHTLSLPVSLDAHAQ